MPKDRVTHSGNNGMADLLIQWGRNEIGDWPGHPRVRLFVIAADMPGNGGTPVGRPFYRGGFMFEPDDDSARSMGLEPGSRVGPVDIMLDREQINRLIRVLRRARDQAYGRDE